MFFKERHSHIQANLPVTDVPRCTSSNAKTLGLENVQRLNVAASSLPPDGAHIVQHWAAGLLIQQNSVSDGEAVMLFRRQPSIPIRWGAFFLSWTM
jgi:hypothetical protein